MIKLRRSVSRELHLVELIALNLNLVLGLVVQELPLVVRPALKSRQSNPEIAEHLLLLRLYANFGVAQDKVELIVGSNRHSRILADVIALLPVQIKQEALARLLDSLGIEAMHRVATNYSPIAELNNREQVFLVIEVIVEIGLVLLVEFVYQLGCLYGSAGVVLKFVYKPGDIEPGHEIRVVEELLFAEGVDQLLLYVVNRSANFCLIYDLCSTSKGMSDFVNQLMLNSMEIFLSFSQNIPLLFGLYQFSLSIVDSVSQRRFLSHHLFYLFFKLGGSSLSILDVSLQVFDKRSAGLNLSHFISKQSVYLPFFYG